jgi:hypothetical protein
LKGDKLICGDSSLVEQLSFQTTEGGAIPTSPLQFDIEIIDVHTACRLNGLWHSRLPLIDWSNVVRNKHSICFGARYNGELYAIAIWSSPVAANRMKNSEQILELRRFAISEKSPKNTGSRMLSIMKHLIHKHIKGVSLLISYQDTEVHNGTIYKAAGWELVSVSKGTSWTNSSRKRNLEQSLSDKARWQLRIRDDLPSLSDKKIKNNQTSLFEL